MRWVVLRGVRRSFGNYLDDLVRWEFENGNPVELRLMLAASRKLDELGTILLVVKDLQRELHEVIDETVSRSLQELVHLAPDRDANLLSRHSEADGTGANKRFKLVHPRIMGFARPSRQTLNHAQVGIAERCTRHPLVA